MPGTLRNRRRSCPVQAASIPYDSSLTVIVNGVKLLPSDLLDYNAFYDIQVLENTDQPSSDVDAIAIETLSIEIDEKLVEIALSPSNSNNFNLSTTGITPQQYNYFKISDEPEVLNFIRVNEEVVLEQYPIDFATLYQPLSTIALDEKATIQAGEFGLEAQRNRIRYENGVNISTTVEDSWLVRSALNRIIGYGTNISIQTLSTSDGLIEFYRSVVFYATSYSPARSGVDPSISWYGEVYCGGYTQYGYVAVDLDYVPCGTPLYVPGYGFAIAMDTGNFDGAWIDLGYEDDNWISWSRPVTVYFLTPIPPQDSIQYIIPPGSTPYLPGFTY
jgi:3D (Asp-Asp-Asp) domain-containing protein